MIYFNKIQVSIFKIKMRLATIYFYLSHLIYKIRWNHEKKLFIATTIDYKKFFVYFTSLILLLYINV